MSLPVGGMSGGAGPIGLDAGGETVFKAQINIDGKDYGRKRPAELSNNLIEQMLKEFHHKKGVGGPKGMVGI